MSWKLLLLRTIFIICCLVAALSSCHSKKKAGSTVVHNKKRSAQSVKKVVSNPVGAPITRERWLEALGISDSDAKKNKLYSFINEWYGAPYKFGGCQKKGVDCSCFVNLLYEEVYKIKLGRMSQDIFKSTDPIQLKEAKEGDLLFFKIGGNKISHVGIYISDNYFIHSSTSKGVILSNVQEAYYKKYFYCAGRVKST